MLQSNARDQVKDLGIAEDTSFAAVSFQGNLYFFRNGASDNGTFFSFSTNGSWYPKVYSISDLVGGQGFSPSTSPSILKFGNYFGFHLF